MGDKDGRFVAGESWRPRLAIQPSAGNSTGSAGGTFAGSARGTAR